MQRLAPTRLLLTIVLAAIITGPAWADNSFGLTSLEDRPVAKSKVVPTLSAEARDFLRQRDPDQARVWVFFIDKGVLTKDGFETAAASVSFSKKVLARRAKVGRDRVLFADLPVRPQYIDEVVSAGAQLRRISRWLNAVSADVPHDILADLEALPFVAEIRPVAGFSREPLPTAPIRQDIPDRQALAPDVLNYGLSQAQLEQISVPPVHDMGYDGSGVTLAIFDTGYRKTHEAFAQAYIEGRVLAEWDFVFGDGNTANETGDWASQWNHGTYIWSAAGGFVDGTLYGPAYRANFILAKTEDIRSETPVEEDNWVAALEWVDGLGADVVTSSLTYSDWYTYEDMDGATATITLAANTAAGLGILVCNAAGNGGPGPGTIRPPADAYDMLAVAAMDANGTIASFSSRGPTYDGRTKPEVGARGVSTSCAAPSSDQNYQTASGTSLSTPLVAGAACLLIQARPNFPPTLIRQALMETANNASTPDNTYGWGIINLESAMTWGANFSADITQAEAPQTVQFTDESTLDTPTWAWSFGDGDSSAVQNPSHTYDEAGHYNVSLTIDTEYGLITAERRAYIILLGDTVTYRTDSVFAGQPATMSVMLRNSQPLDRMVLPFTYAGGSLLSFDSVSLGDRTAYFERIRFISSDAVARKYVVELTADVGGGSPPLEAGYGEVMKIHFSTNQYAFGGVVANVDSLNESNPLLLQSEQLAYDPQQFYPATLSTIQVIRGDVDYSLDINIADVTYLVAHLFLGGPAPVSLQAGDIALDFQIGVDDLTYLVAFLFEGGPPPPTP